MRGLREANRLDIRLGLAARVWQCQWIILSVDGWGWWATGRQAMTSKRRSTWTEATKDQVAHACLNLGTDRVIELIQFWEMSDLHSDQDLFFNFLWIRVSKQIISCSRKIWPCLLVHLSVGPRASGTLRVQGHSFCSRLWWRSSQTLASFAQYTLPTSPWQDVPCFIWGPALANKACLAPTQPVWLPIPTTSSTNDGWVGTELLHLPCAWVGLTLRCVFCTTPSFLVGWSSSYPQG